MKKATLYPKWTDVVEFGADAPVHKKLVDTPGYKSVIVGMEKAQSIQPHGAEAETYHFVQGSGRLLAGGEAFKVGPGATVVVLDGVSRGIEADTRLVFLASHGSSENTRRKPAMRIPVRVSIGVLVMMGIMAGLMFGPTLMMSRPGITAVGMKGLIYLPLVGIALLAVAMFFFYSRMAGKGGGMVGHMMGSSSENKAEKNPAGGTLTDNTPSTDTLTAAYDVPDVSCAHCKMTIESEVGRLQGVVSVDVNIQAKRATVRYREPATATAIELKLKETGYPPTSLPRS